MCLFVSFCAFVCCVGVCVSCGGCVCVYGCVYVLDGEKYRGCVSASWTFVNVSEGNEQNLMCVKSGKISVSFVLKCVFV